VNTRELSSSAGTLVLAVALSAGGAIVGLSSAAAQLPYADTEWRSVHQGPRNADYVPISIDRRFVKKWTALDGAATLAAPTIGPEGHIYQTTGQGPGASNLHAFDHDGNLLWATPPWSSTADFDSCAVLQGTIIDDAGDLYVSDCNQFWAFHSNGDVKWVIDLPAPPPGAPFQDGTTTTPINPFITAFFTLDGSVGGVTVFGDVVIVSRVDGSSQAPIINLPGDLAPPTTQQFPPSLWQGGLLDPEIIQLTFHAFFASNLECVNTPAVQPTTGRIFVTGTDVTPSLGTLYGLDFTPGSPGQIEIATTSVIGTGSGSSPAISPDGAQIYVSDDSGTLYAFDTATGENVWSISLGAAPGSASVGPDGTIYLLAVSLKAVTPDGTLKWDADLSGLVDEFLPEDPDFTGRFARPNGIPTVTDNALLVPYHLGYLYDFLEQERPIPIYQVYVTLDRATGELLPGSAPYFARGTNEAFVVPLRDGTVIVNAGEFVSTGIALLAGMVNPLLSEGLQVIGSPGGLEVLRGMECHGDCNGDGTVTVDELLKGVNIALGTADLSGCEIFDSNPDGEVTVDELVRAINAALQGCT